MRLKMESNLEVCYIIQIFFLLFDQNILALPLLEPSSEYANPFVGFYVFPHGGITLDPIGMDYSSQPGFNKPDSKKRAIILHKAMKKSVDALILSNPDLIIFSTPHGFSLLDNLLIFSTLNAAGSAGDLWKDFTASFEIDRELSSILYGELKGAKNPVDLLSLGVGHETASLLWAEVIPWYFIINAAKKARRRVPKAIYIGQPGRINLQDLTQIGRDIVKTALLRKEFSNKRIAVVISGDLSHLHSNDPMAPYPYNPISSTFDKFIVDWAKLDRTPDKQRQANTQLLVKAGAIQDDSGHCGFSGMVLLNGMMEEVVNQKWNYKSHFYAYEVPSYFGMMVVAFLPEPGKPSSNNIYKRY